MSESWENNASDITVIQCKQAETVRFIRDDGAKLLTTMRNSLLNMKN